MNGWAWKSGGGGTWDGFLNFLSDLFQTESNWTRETVVPLFGKNILIPDSPESRQSFRPSIYLLMGLRGFF